MEEYRSADSNIVRRNIGLLTVTLIVEEYRSADSNIVRRNIGLLTVTLLGGI